MTSTSSNKLSELEQSISNLFMYYHRELQNQGVIDTRQVMATRIPHLINLSEEQLKFIETYVEDPMRLSEMLNDMSDLLQALKYKKEYDEESIEILITCLVYINSVIGG